MTLLTDEYHIIASSSLVYSKLLRTHESSHADPLPRSCPHLRHQLLYHSSLQHHEYSDCGFVLQYTRHSHGGE